MPTKYNPKDKFTAKEGDFEVLYMPKKGETGKGKSTKATGKGTKKK